LLREAIEIHITLTILERSLILDSESISTVEAHLNQKFPKRSAARLAQRQIKLAFYMVQEERIFNVLKVWGAQLGDLKTGNGSWAASFCVFLIMTLVMDKTIGAAYDMCEGRIKLSGRDPKKEREKFSELLCLLETQVFQRCKELFHCRYKTRKGEVESCNPIRDGVSAWRSKSSDGQVDWKTLHLASQIRNIVQDFGIGRHTWSVGREARRPDEMEKDANAPPAYTTLGRLIGIFLSDF
jgi:hypothetical protein